jgi:hypothetical protein
MVTVSASTPDSKVLMVAEGLAGIRRSHGAR